jgi:hypothetical protein
MELPPQHEFTYEFVDKRSERRPDTQRPKKFGRKEELPNDGKRRAEDFLRR